MKYSYSPVFCPGYIFYPVLPHCSARTTLVYSPFHDVKTGFEWVLKFVSSDGKYRKRFRAKWWQACSETRLLVSSWITFWFEMCRSHKIRFSYLFVVVILSCVPSPRHDQLSLHLLVLFTTLLTRDKSSFVYSPKKFTSSPLNRSWYVPFSFSPPGLSRTS
jgi:hypothetical protein